MNEQNKAIARALAVVDHDLDGSDRDIWHVFFNQDRHCLKVTTRRVNDGGRLRTYEVKIEGTMDAPRVLFGDILIKDYEDLKANAHVVAERVTLWNNNQGESVA